MAYRTTNMNNATAIFFAGNPATGNVFESNGSFTIDPSNATLQIPNGGYIGSQSDSDALQIATNGDITLSQSLSIAGDLTVNGSTTTVSSTNTVVSDTLIELNTGASSNANDCGIVIERGSTGDNAIIAWDESADKFTLGTTTATGGSTGNLSITAGTLVANLEGDVTGDLTGDVTGNVTGNVTGDVTGDVSGNAGTSTKFAATKNFSITGEITASAVAFDGSSNVELDADIALGAIDNQTELDEAPHATNDYILLFDASASGLKKINRSNFVSGLGGFSSFDITDGTTTQTVSDGNTVTFTDGTNIDVAVSATDTVTIGISDAGLNSIAGLTTAADKMIYTTSSDTYAVTSLTSFGRSLIDDADAAAARTTLGVDAAGTDNSTDVTLTGARNYITISSQTITVGEIDISDDTNLAVDSSTITLSGDTLSVTSGGIDTAQLAAGAVTEAKIERTVDSSFSDNDTIASDINLVAGGSGGITVKLPSPSSGKKVIVKKSDSAAGTVTISRNSTETIDGANTKILYYQYESMTFVSDGTNWFVV